MNARESETLIQVTRYGVNGIAVNLAGYLVYLAITGLGGEPKITMSGLYIVGVAMSFVLNRKFTFRYEEMSKAVFLRFLTAYLIGYMINLLGLVFGTDVLGFPHQAVQAVMIVLVAGFLFVMQKMWVFKTVQKKLQ